MSKRLSEAEEWKLEIAFAEDARAKPPRRPRNGVNPMRMMVEFALEQGCATSVGDLLDQIASVNGHRMFNSMIIVLQRPHSTHLASPDEWRSQWSRDIRPGESPVLIMWPFSPVHFLFEVSQTLPREGAPELPLAWENPYAMTDARDSGYALHWLTENAKNDGVVVDPARHGFRSAGCIQLSRTDRVQSVQSRDGSVRNQGVRVRYEVMVNGAYSETERLVTLTHELGHLYCGHLGAMADDWWPARDVPSQAVREFEAESVSRLVFRRLAPDLSLPPHLNQYFGAGAPAPTDGWRDVANAADRVLDMCVGISPTRRGEPSAVPPAPTTARD